MGIMAAVMPVQAAVDLEAKYNVDTNYIALWPKAADIMADTGIVMEASTGAVVYEKGADERRYPASITKLMTLLVAVENAGLDEQVTFTETGIRDVTPDSGNVGMKLGETMSMKDCLYAMIIHSANEVSAQIAEHVGGTEAHFIEMMNEKAAELGCKNTHFTNASGLPDPNQYTTARDMAMIYRAGLENKTFRKIMKKRGYTIPATNMSDKRTVYTHHPLYSELSSIFNPDCIGGKSGRTNDAGSTLVTGMKKDGITYIAVVMRDVDINQSGVDTQKLFDYAYGQFQKVYVEGGYVIIPKNITLSDLRVEEKTIKSRVRQSYYLEDHYVGKGHTVLATPTPEPVVTEEAAAGETVNTEAEETTEGLSDTAKFLLVIMAVMVVILIILCIMLAVKDHKRYNRRR